MPKWERYTIEAELKVTVRDENGKQLTQILSCGAADAGSNPDVDNRDIPRGVEAAVQQAMFPMRQMASAYGVARGLQLQRPNIGVTL